MKSGKSGDMILGKGNMKQVWFTSDYHLGHRNIIHLCERPFADVEEMGRSIVERHNALVQADDIVYDLGDFSFRSSAEDAVSWLAKLNGKRHIIFGNHDKSLRQAHRQGLLDDLISSGKLTLIGDDNPRIQMGIRVNVEGQEIVLAHYAQRSWQGAFRGAWHLYGHSHGNLPPFRKSMDVGVDAHDFNPLSFAEIKARMDSIGEDFAEL